MICSPRLNKILQICLESNDYVSIEELSSLLQISKRTVFREVQDTAYILKPFDLTLQSKPKKGLYIEGSENQKEVLYQALQAEKMGYLKKEDRHKLLIFEILKENRIQKLYYYAELFQVSQATISNDLDILDSWFQKYNLKVNRTPGLGIELLGSEENYRKALTSILAESIYDKQDETIDPYDANSLLKQIFMDDKNGILSLLNQDILQRILRLFHQYEEELDLIRYAQSSYIGLIIHLTIAIDRILKNEKLEDNDYIVSMMKDDYSYKQAQHMCTYLEEEFEIQIPEVEISFIAMHIKGAKLTQNSLDDGPIEIAMYKEEELLVLIHKMIDTLPTPHNVMLKSDRELLQGMIAHLRPTLVRLSHHMPIYNPLLAQLKELHKDIYEQAIVACACISEVYGYTVPEDEVGYVAMHFGAAMEREEKKDIVSRDIHIGIVCSSGIGVSAMLLARLEKVCDEFVSFETLSIEDIRKKTFECDLLVSTFTFETDEEVILVNPLLPNNDIQKLQDAIARKRRTIKRAKTMTPPKSEIDLLASDIFQLLDSVELCICDYRLDKLQLINEVAKNISKDKMEEEAIYKVLIHRENMNSTVFNEMGFALFHGFLTSEDTCILKVFRSNHGEFIHDELSNIKFVIAMFIPEKHTKNQKKLMSMISRSIIENDQLYNSLATGDYNDIYVAIELLMKDFLFQHLHEERSSS